MHCPALLNGVVALNEGVAAGAMPVLGAVASPPHETSNPMAPAVVQARKRFLFMVICLRRHLE
jgi:hypothetical protein